MAKEPKKIGEMDGWTMTEDADGVLEATKDGMRPVRVGGGPDTPRDVLRARLFEAMAESDGVAAGGGDTVAAARGGTIGHDATIVVHDEKGE